MQFLNPGLLGGAQEFRRRYALPVEKFGDGARAEQLKRLVQPFLLRRLKTDRSIISDLPEKQEIKVFCNLTREQATLYGAVVRDMMDRIERADGIERRGLVLAVLTKLKQVCNHPVHFLKDQGKLEGRSGKLSRLAEMLEESFATGQRALVFTQYAEMGGLLQAFIREQLGRQSLFLHGGVGQKARDAMVAEFQREGDGPPAMILSLKAGGTGLNLTAASQVFHFDRWWNPAVEDQATDRAFRIGQTRNVQVYKYVCLGTMEERIDAMIDQKKKLASSVIGSGEAWLTELSTAELRRVLELSADAVGEE
jgi:SNF2 family DNA or RNA helicase